MAPKKRRPPPEVKPVLLDGVRYEAPLSGARFGVPQSGGVVVARDAATDEVLWATAVYTAPSDPEIEADKSLVYISAMKAEPGGGALRIRNEHGESFRLDLATREARPLSGG